MPDKEISGTQFGPLLTDRGVTFRRPEEGNHPPNDSPGYRSTALRVPKEPLVIIPHTLSELTGPVYPYGRMDVSDRDLTRQHANEPLGELIIVEGIMGVSIV